MALCTFSDANDWLDGTKIRFENEADAASERNEAERVVKGLLADVYPDHVNLWDESGTPESVPGLVRAITGMLMAAYRYQKRYSEETQTPSTFAIALEGRAMDFLNRLRVGSMGLDDVDYASALGFREADFWPNDTTIVWEHSDLLHIADGDELRFFKMDSNF